MKSRSIFEIGIYRCSRQAFNAQYERDLDAHREDVKAEWQQYGADVPNNIMLQRKHSFWKRYGGPWKYNQVVGWLELAIEGKSIRGQLWKTDAKRYQRNMRRRQISLWRGTALDVRCYPEQTSKEIEGEVRHALAEFQKRFRKGACVLDLDCFDNAAPYVNWRAMLGFGDDGEGEAGVPGAKA